MRQRIIDEKIPLNIHRGNEFGLDLGFNDHEKKINTIAGGRYILVELKDELIFAACKNFFKAIIAKGYNSLMLKDTLKSSYRSLES